MRKAVFLTKLVVFAFALSFVCAPAFAAESTTQDDMRPVWTPLKPNNTAGSVGTTSSKEKKGWFSKKGSASDKGSATEKKATKKVAKKASHPKSGYTKTSAAYPTGRASSSALLIEKKFPNTVLVGQPYDYTITVTNLTDMNLDNVSISEETPSGFTVNSSDPKAASTFGGKAKWNLGTLKPKQSVDIHVNGKLAGKGDAPCCTSAEYDVPALCHAPTVVSPALALDLEAPAEVLVCNKIPLVYTVKNTGDSHLDNVIVKSALPSGVMTADGGSDLTFKAGSLAPGAAKKLTAYVQAKNTGLFSFKGSAESGGVTASSGLDSTKVTKPTLTLTAVSTKSKQFAGRNIGYSFVVKNTGTTAAESTSVVAKLPSNANFKSASDGGRSSGGAVRWDLGTLAAGASKRLTVDLTSAQAGVAKTEAKATATCCEAAADSATVTIAGIPALLLEVIDVVDPIEVGDAETYVIKVTNQGTADATNVKIVANLEDMDYVSSTGKTNASVSGGTITFDAVPVLGAKAVATWNIKVTGKKAGDLRFKVKMTSDQLTRPVEETESTFVY